MKFYTCGNENSRTHINEVMTQLSDQFIQEWSSHLNGGDKTTGNKLRTYKLFKNQFQLEYYLVCQLPTKHQIALTKFRVSCHNLAIETGRYHKPSSLPVEQRLCPTCKEIEDEIHLLCQCRRNAGLRRNLFRTVTQYHTQFEMLDPVEKTIFLMQLKDEHIIRELAAFIFTSSVFYRHMAPWLIHVFKMYYYYYYYYYFHAHFGNMFCATTNTLSQLRKYFSQ